MEFPELFRLRDELTLKEGLIFYRGKRFLSEIGNRGEILEAGHDLHLGITRNRNRIREVFWWPGMPSEVKLFLEGCPECEMSDQTQKTCKTPLIPVPLPKKPWDKIAVDIKGPMNDQPCRYLLVMVDYHSK